MPIDPSLISPAAAAPAAAPPMPPTAAPPMCRPLPSPHISAPAGELKSAHVAALTRMGPIQVFLVGIPRLVAGNLKNAEDREEVQKIREHKKTRF